MKQRKKSSMYMKARRSGFGDEQDSSGHAAAIVAALRGLEVEVGCTKMIQERRSK